MKSLCIALMAAMAAWGQSVYTGTWTSTGTATSGGANIAAGDVYVAPASMGGDDVNPCTLAQPCLTPQHATAVVRGMPGGAHTVWLRGGNYFLSSPWTFNAGDSGTPATPILYQNYPSETPVVSGGRQVANAAAGISGTWTDLGINYNGCGSTCRGWKITGIDADSTHANYWLNAEALYYNRERRYRPRLNSGNYYTIVDACFTSVQNGDTNYYQVPVGQTLYQCPGPNYIYYDRFHYQSSVTLSSTYNGMALGDVELLDFEKWTMARLRVASIDTTNHVVVTTGPTVQANTNGFLPNHRFLIENVKEALKAPGQWYLDRCNPTCSSKTWDLYYLADVSKGEDPTTAEIILPQQSTVLAATGTHDVTFSGITFAHDNFLVPPEGLAELQGMPSVPGALQLNGTIKMVFDSVTVRNTQGIGVDFFRTGTMTTSTGNEVKNSLIYDTGGQAIRVGKYPVSTGTADTEANVVQYTTIDNNFLGYTGRYDPSSTTILWIGNSHHNTVTHNEIAYSYGGGIAVGKTMGFNPPPGGAGGCATGSPNLAPWCLAHDNHIDSNYIHHTMMGVLNDSGAIYAHSGNTTGNRATYNRITDSFSALNDKDGYNGSLIYLDGSSSNWLVQDNLLARASNFCIVQTGSDPNDIYPMNNLYDNNVLVDCGSTAKTQNTNHDQGWITKYGTGPSWATLTHNIVSQDLSKSNVMALKGRWGCFDPTTGNPVSCTSMWLEQSNAFWNRASGHSLANQFRICTLFSTCGSNTTDYTLLDLSGYQGAAYGQELGSIGNQDPLFRMNGPDDYVPTNAALMGTIGFSAFDVSTAGRSNPVLNAPAQAEAYPTVTLAGSDFGSWPPAVVSVAPTSGSSTGGTSVTISGAYFQAGATVSFGTNAATSVVVVNASTITALSPAGSAGTTVSVTVTNPDSLSATLTSAFTYNTVATPYDPIPPNAYADDTACDTMVPNAVEYVTPTAGGADHHPYTRQGLIDAVTAAHNRRVSSNQSTKIVVDTYNDAVAHSGGPTIVYYNSNYVIDMSLYLPNDLSTDTSTKYIKITSSNPGAPGVRFGHWAINTISRATSGTVTATTLDPVPFAAGKIVIIDRVADPTFNGYYTVASVAGNGLSFTYSQSALNTIRWATPTAASSTGGYVRTADNTGRTAWSRAHAFTIELNGLDAIAFKMADISGDPTNGPYHSSHHYCLGDYEAQYRDTRLENDGVTQVDNQLSLSGLGTTPHAWNVAQLPHHVGISRAYIHAYDDIDGNGTSTWATKAVGANCMYCFVVDSDLDEIHGHQKESHDIGINNTPGPIRVVNNHLGGSSESFFTGGTPPVITGMVSGDPGGIEVAQNEIDMDRHWFTIPDSGSGDETKANYVLKNRIETKSSVHTFFYGNRARYVSSYGQVGMLLLPQPQMTDNSNACEGINVSDVLFQHNLFAHTSQGVQNGGRYPGGGSSANNCSTWGSERELFDNNLFFDIGDFTRYGNPGNPSRALQIGATGTYWTGCTASRTGGVATVTCPAGASKNELYISPGDPVLVYGCTGDTTFNTAADATQPTSVYAKSTQNPLSLSVIYDNAGANSSATGCTVNNRAGFPMYYTWKHDAMFGKSFYFPMNPAVGGTSYPRYHRYFDSIMGSVGSTGGIYCSATGHTAEGLLQTQAGGCYDFPSLEYYSMVEVGRTLSKYTALPSGKPANFAPASLGCSGTPDATCMGLRGNYAYPDPEAGGEVTSFVSGSGTATVGIDDQHGLLVGQKVIELYEDAGLITEIGVYTIASVPDGNHYTRTASSTKNVTGRRLGYVWTGRDMYDFALCHTGDYGCAGPSYYAAGQAGDASDGKDQGPDIDAIYRAWRGRGYVSGQ